MMERKNIEFKTRDGLTLRGELTLPDEKSVPIVIFLPAFGTVRVQVTTRNADTFSRAGFATLAYDHRCFGLSDGLPRQHVDLQKQVEDAFDAVTYVSTLVPDVDANRIALHGLGHGGGVSIQATALDSRIKAVIAQVPALSGAIDVQIYPEGLLDRARQARINSVKLSGTESEYIQLFPDNNEEAEDPKGFIIGGQAGFGFYSFVKSLADTTGFNWDNRVTLQSAYSNYAHEFRSWIPRIAPRPLFYVAPSGDMFPTGPHIEAFRNVGNTSEILVLEPFDFAGYVLETGTQTVQLEVDWLKKQLS